LLCVNVCIWIGMFVAARTMYVSITQTYIGPCLKIAFHFAVVANHFAISALICVHPAAVVKWSATLTHFMIMILIFASCF
jgi:hypothetical protein